MTLRNERNKSGQVVFGLDNVYKHYPVHRGLFSVFRLGAGRFVRAVDGVALEMYKGELLGLAGESGSGKTVTGELLVRLQDITRGTITYNGQDVSRMRGRELKRFHREVQMIFQDPYETLNPRHTVYHTLAEPLTIHGMEIGSKRRSYIIKVLEDCGVQPAEAYLDRYPHQLSGGERQRVAVARALVLRPSFIVADEPTSMLDVSIRAGVLNLLRKLQQEHSLSMVFISHDLTALRSICDRIAVMYLGRIVEVGPTDQMLSDPRHPYTQGLLASVPRIEPRPDQTHAPLEGEIPDPTDIPSGCRFASRCVHRMKICSEDPPLLPVGNNRQVACHLEFTLERNSTKGGIQDAALS